MPPRKENASDEPQSKAKILITKAGFLIQSLTEFEAFLAEHLTCNDEDMINIRLETIMPSLNEYNCIYAELLALSETTPEVLTKTEFDKKYFTLVSKARKLLRSFENPSINQNVSQVNAECVSRVTLPQLSLPTFSGEYSEWMTFKDHFNSIVNQNSNLTDTQKFHYLRSCLKQGALQLISSLAPTNDNYKIAFDLLKERFEQPKLILQTHINNIFNLKPITSTSASQLQQLHDTLSQNMKCVENLNISKDQLIGCFLSNILMSKFNTETKEAFKKFKPDSVLTLDELNEFLKKRCNLLVQLNDEVNTKTKYSNVKPEIKKEPLNQCNYLATESKIKCPLCSEAHFVNQCAQFLALSVSNRINKVRELKICLNCLKHSADKRCFSRFNCRTCNKMHHTMLHLGNQQESPANAKNITTPNAKAPEKTQAMSCQTKKSCVFLSTAKVKVQDVYGVTHIARCLLDSASQSNFITNEFAEKLHLTKYPTNVSITGINSVVSKSNFNTEFSIQSLYNDYTVSLNCLVTPKITDELPAFPISKTLFSVPKKYFLADPEFNKPQRIDILIGASHFYEILLSERALFGKGNPALQNTNLGWIVTGNIDIPVSMNSHTFCSTSHFELNNSLVRFWEIEDIFPKNENSKLSPDEKVCEEHFSKTVYNEASGRFVVSIPFNKKISSLGDSKTNAINRFLSLERRFDKNPELRLQYSNFIHEYLILGHMSKVETPLNQLKPPYFIMPHHEIIKSSSLTTKLRVVFDGSARSTTGISINDTQLCGPSIQSDLFSILIRFRKHRIALTGDIEKMYRQILITPEQRKFQCILWRDDSRQDLQLYQLNTVTYGTAAASYLATKCLEYLANELSDSNPGISDIISTDFYMDDLLTGADSIPEAIEIQKQISDCLSRRGFPLRKFLSNSPEVLNIIDSQNQQGFFTFPLGERETAKTLGISWNSVQDTIHYEINAEFNVHDVTKRSILSCIAQLFDPLGLLGPVIILPKILIQTLWKLQLSWDEPVPDNLRQQWLDFLEQLYQIKLIKTPRCVLLEGVVKVELHGFGDASEKAYGACIYLKSVDQYGNTASHVIASKTRVAPLKSVSLPRLELCAAVLLSQLMSKVKESLKISIDRTFFYSDSTIVLSWINSAPNNFKTFVANRIASIHELSSQNQWYHVRSKDNPADLLSRGITISQLISNAFWWHGSDILNVSNLIPFSDSSAPMCNMPEVKIKSIVLNNVTKNNELFDKFSDIRIQRVVAWIFRFINNARSKGKLLGPLTTEELRFSLLRLAKICQEECFKSEIVSLQKHNKVPANSSILNLSPFLDINNLIRVGGRLGNSPFGYDKRHPILLPKNHPLTNIIISHYHKKMLHSGAQQTLACVREFFWPISGKNICKQIVNKCVTCFRVNPSKNFPKMGELPISRVNPNVPPFYKTGIDYAGPILLKDRYSKPVKLIKSYICVFVCQVTRAIHLELVTSLSTEAFISMLRRFISRRGKPKELFSDNAKNFVGAFNYLKDLYKFLRDTETQTSISNFLIQDDIIWHFIPSHSPHFGGMWESSVKSTKYYLRRILGNATCNYEEMTTILAQIEAILNSRPLSPLSANPNDFEPLTSGHFLIGRPLVALQETISESKLTNNLNRYNFMQGLIQQFWRRWSKEVVPELQKRTKWQQSSSQRVAPGALVLIKDDNLPAYKWSLGRISAVHPGEDGIIRAVTVRMPNQSESRRVIHNLCVLPDA